MTELAKEITLRLSDNPEYLLVCWDDGFSNFCIRVPVDALKKAIEE